MRTYKPNDICFWGTYIRLTTPVPGQFPNPCATLSDTNWASVASLISGSLWDWIIGLTERERLLPATTVHLCGDYPGIESVSGAKIGRLQCDKADQFPTTPNSWKKKERQKGKLIVGGFHIWLPHYFWDFWTPSLLFVLKICPVCPHIWGSFLPLSVRTSYKEALLWGLLERKIMAEGFMMSPKTLFFKSTIAGRRNVWYNSAL